MSISVQYVPKKYITDGTTRTFNFTWSLTQAADIRVYFVTEAGAENLVDPSNYTLQRFANEEGGNIIFNVAPTAGQTLLIARIGEKTQEQDLSNTKTFDMEVFEDIVDKLTRLVQDLSYGSGRKIEIPATAPEDLDSSLEVWQRMIFSDPTMSMRYAKIEDGILQVSADGGTWIKIPKSSDISAFRQKQVMVGGETVNILEYLIGSQWHEVGKATAHSDLTGKDAASQHPATSITADSGATTVQAKLNTATSHIANTSNPHSVTKTQVGLENVDNTSDTDKPISTATQTSLNAKADDSAVVHLAGTETITGEKSFVEAIIATGGFKDADVSTAIKLGDSGNTVPTTGNKTIIGAINELNTKSSLPDQTGNSGKFLTTDGTESSWDDVPDTFSKINNNFLNVKASEELTATHTITFDSTNNIQQLSASGSLSASTVTLVFPTTTSTESYTFELQVDCGATIPNITWSAAETIHWNNGEVGNINDGSKMTLFIFRKQGSVVYANVGGVF